MTYPAFLLHWPIAVVAVRIFFSGNEPPGAVLFLAATPVVLVVSWLAAASQQPLGSIRARIREWGFSENSKAL